MRFATLFLIFLSVVPALAAPEITALTSGIVSHGNSVSFSVSAPGTKSTAAPVAWDNLEDGVCSTTATIGTWSSVNALQISTVNQRHSLSTRNATAAFVAAGDEHGYFTGGSDSPRWFAQYWWYIPSNFQWRGGNIKMFRFWSTGSGTNNWYFLPRPGTATGHGMLAWDEMPLTSNYYSGTCPPDAGTGWYPLTQTDDCVDAVFGRSCNCSDWLAKGIEWRGFDTDMPHSTWHLFQVEWGDSDVDTANGQLRIWADGRLIFEKTNLTTRTTSQPSQKRPKEVGWYNSNTTDAIGDLYIDDAYIDNSWARVEIGDASTYAACTHREIQPITVWGATTTITVNQGSFANDASAYLFLIDDTGAPSPGYSITFGTGAPPIHRGGGAPSGGSWNGQ
ncbi:MAG: hypothetical protein M0Z43_02155 [Acidithiobacillus sp.]|nr:hypothetical protein [Acidithiobacillus sp.]